MLEKGATAGALLDRTPHAQAQPVFIAQFRTGTPVLAMAAYFKV